MNFSKTPRLSENAMERLKTYSWPGNVRELQNLIERAMIIAPDAPLKRHRYLPRDPMWLLDTYKTTNVLKDLVERQIETSLDRRMTHGGVKIREVKPETDGQIEHSLWV
ncbi:hypothetical protein [Desulfobacula sp.]|uniref:hypothetical protein n=1 Tax=Desulfobacula sp. TaxID=2593537 RepID=UPI002611330C|nr:hypothetical protein [Desulfobacula sp.]